MRKRLLFLTVLLVPSLAFAQIFGTIVFDPTQAGNMVKEIAQVLALYQTATQTYNQIVANAVWMQNRGTWLGLRTQIMNSNTGNLFGETAAWNPAVTTNIGVSGAWGRATFGIHPPPFYAGFPIGASSMSANIASVEVGDGMSQAGMASIGNSRANQPLNDVALTNLEQMSQDASLDTNSEIEQLNIANGGIVLMNRQAQNENALLTTIAEQQILANKIQRDTVADAINVQSVRDTYIANSSTQWGGSAATISGYAQ